MRTALRLLVVVLAVAAALVPLPPAWVERVYSGAIFPRVQALVTSVSNVVPFALFDLLIAAAMLWWLTMVVSEVRRVRREQRGRASVAIAVRTVTFAAAAYLVFLALWGLNYRRVPLLERVPFNRAQVNPAAALALLTRSVEQLNVLSDDAHRQIWTDRSTYDPSLAAAFVAAQAQVAGSGRIVPARPKSTLLDLYFRRASVAGMTDPYFLETMLASDLLLVEIPS